MSLSKDETISIYCDLLEGELNDLKVYPSETEAMMNIFHLVQKIKMLANAKSLKTL